MRALALGICAFTGACSGSAEPTVASLRYAKASTAQQLNLYLPKGKGPFPLVIMIHGGAFLFGDQDDAGPGFKDDVDALKADGIAVASIGYRLSGEAPFPAAVQDVVAAIGYLRDHAAERRIDATRFALWGKSAGANLALVAGLAHGQRAADNLLLAALPAPARVRAIVAFYPPVDFALMDRQLAARGCKQGSGPFDGPHDAANSPESRYLGAPLRSVPLKVARSNPTTYVTADAPAVYLSAGSADCTVPADQSRLMFEALRRRVPTADVQLHIVEGAEHADPVFDRGQSLERTRAFLRRHLNG